MVVIAGAGIVWLAAVFFFPFILGALTFSALVLPAVHCWVRRKGMRDFAEAPVGWQTCISECVSEAARQLKLSRKPSVGIAGRAGEVFKRLFPSNGYVLLPSGRVTSPIDTKAAKLISDVIKHQLAHIALGHHNLWEEAFLLALRPLPVLYASFRRTCDLSADRLAFSLFAIEEKPDSDTLSRGSHGAVLADTLVGFSCRVKRIFYWFYSPQPDLEMRARELRRYQERLDRRERITGMIQRSIPGMGQIIGQRRPWTRCLSTSKGKIRAWIGIAGWKRPFVIGATRRRSGRRQALVGPVIGVVTVCIIALLITSGIDEIVGLKRHAWNNKAGSEKPHAKQMTNRIDTIRLPPAPPVREIIPESISQGEKPKPGNREHASTKPSATRLISRRDLSGRSRASIIESSANSTLRMKGCNRIKAVAAPDGSLTLIGSTFSSREKRIAFMAVRGYTYTGKIRDLVYVVEE